MAIGSFQQVAAGAVQLQIQLGILQHVPLHIYNAISFFPNRCYLPKNHSFEAEIFFSSMKNTMDDLRSNTRGGLVATQILYFLRFIQQGSIVLSGFIAIHFVYWHDRIHTPIPTEEIIFIAAVSHFLTKLFFPCRSRRHIVENKVHIYSRCSVLSSFRGELHNVSPVAGSSRHKTKLRPPPQDLSPKQHRNIHWILLPPTSAFHPCLVRGRQ